MEPHSLIAQYQLEPYRGSYDKLQQIAVMFTGTPRATGDPGKVLLLNDPGSRHSFYYEFRTEDIVYAEEGATLSLPDGSTATTARLWVRKGATGLRIESFHVQDTRAGLADFLGV